MDIANKYADSEESLLYEMQLTGQPMAESPKTEGCFEQWHRNIKGHNKHKVSNRANGAKLVAAGFSG